MKKRICYDYYFLPKNNFEFNGEQIRGVSLMVKFRILINGKEFFYDEDEDKEKPIFIYRGRKFYPINFLKCYYDAKRRSYKFEKNLYVFQLAEILGKKIALEYNPVYFSKDSANKDSSFGENINISRKEFDKILEIGNFNTTDNMPAQNLAYLLVED